MQMLDRLAAVLTDIGDNAIAVGQTRSLCNLGNGKENVAHGIGVVPRLSRLRKRYAPSGR